MIDTPQPEASAPYRPGMVIGNKFVLLRFIAQGGMSAVFEAKDELVQRHVAIKLLHPQHVHNAEVIGRFRREAQLTASIQHPNVVAVHEMGQQRDGSFYLVQELLRGDNLRTHLFRRGLLPATEALEILLPIMGALIAAHTQGIIHRDIKPENIVLSSAPSGEILPKLIDFGIAKAEGGGPKLTAVGTLLGTPDYMSPEQITGSPPPDARTDVWAVGVVLYELLSGTCPHGLPECPPAAMLGRILTVPARPLRSVAHSVAENLEAIVHRAVEPDLGRRFASMQALRDELLAFLNRPAPASLQKTQGPPLVDEETEPAAPAAKAAVHTAAPAAADSTSTELKQDWVDPEGPTPLEEIPSPVSAGQAPLSKPVLSVRSSPLKPEAAWIQDSSALPSSQCDRDADDAERALGENRLLEAIELADRALSARPPPTVAGRMKLLQAIAHRWLGNYEKAYECAQEASAQLDPGSGAWYAALGHAAAACGWLGRNKPLLAIYQELKRVEVTEERGHFHATVVARIAVFLIRTGMTNVAQRIMAEADRLLSSEDDLPALVRAWRDLAHAELAMRRGDLVEHLRRVEAAALGFAAAGDLRNACLQRAKVGNAYMQLGNYHRAAVLLGEALDVAEPMGLDFVSQARVTAGFALAQLGQTDQAVAMVSAALKQCVQRNDNRTTGVALIYLATIHMMRNEVEHAAKLAQQAVDTLDAELPTRAYALATLARVMLLQKRSDAALRHASQAMELLQDRGGEEEGETVIRMSYALSLRATGQEAEGRAQLADARRRLLVRADRIQDPSWRRSFLEGVIDNARLMRLAAQWLDGEGRG